MEKVGNDFESFRLYICEVCGLKCAGDHDSSGVYFLTWNGTAINHNKSCSEILMEDILQ